jgi:hypothetical protein
MTPVPRIIETIDNLQKSRNADLIKIFSTIAYRKKAINVQNFSISGSLIFGISDSRETGQNFRDWRFQTISENIKANYHEVWINQGRNKYFLERSYFHLYTVVEEDLSEGEYILLHCDASEPGTTPHSIYKQSPHIHIEVAEQPIPKAHFALYNGRLAEVLKNRASFNSALLDSITMLNSQILQAHPLI